MTETTWITMPWALRPDTLLGAALLAVVAAVLGEFAWRMLRWPRLMGPLAVGTVLCAAGLGFDAAEPALRLAIDMALALLLFEAGARVGLRWLGRNRWLLLSCLAEALLSAVAVWSVARFWGLPAAAAVPLALIAMAVSPVVVQRVVGECGAAGQVTERLMAIATLNTLLAIVLLKTWNAGLDVSHPERWAAALPAAAFGFLGALLLAVVLAEGLAVIARRLDLRDDHAAVLVLSCVLLIVVVAKTLNLSTLLVPLLAGLWLRNRRQRPWVWPRHFGSAGSALVLVLFVATAAAPSPGALMAGAALGALLVCTRALTKTLVVSALALPSGLSWRQGFALSAGLLPLSATAWVLALDEMARQPELTQAWISVLLSMMFIVELAAPLAMRWSLRWVGEIQPTVAPSPAPAVSQPARRQAATPD